MLETADLGGGQAVSVMKDRGLLFHNYRAGKAFALEPMAAKNLTHLLGLAFCKARDEKQKG